MNRQELIRSRITEADSGCWIWQGAVGSNGYGHCQVARRTVAAHRHSYEVFVGPIPQGLQIDHLCRTPRCVNPDHLEPVTGLENARRRSPKYNHCRSGHELTDANTYVIPGRGARDCRACIRDRVRRYKARRTLTAASTKKDLKS